MSSAAVFAVVEDVGNLFTYPISSADRLSSHSWFAFDYVRWDQSEFRVRADLDVRGAFLELLCSAQKGTPVGTLPVDDDLLAYAAGVTLEVWRKMCQRPVGPLYGWQRCRCDNGKIRLYHKVVLEVVQEAISGRAKWLENAAAERERKRLADLPRKIVRAGGTQRMADDPVSVLRLDQYLLEWLAPGKSRTIAVVRQAMEAMETGVHAAL